MKFNKILFCLIAAGCSTKQDTKEQPTEEPRAVTFASRQIANDANLWWARDFVDVNGDGILDVALQDNNGSGGWLGYLAGSQEQTHWEKVIVAEVTPKGNKFAAGDLEVADLDGDGDIDLIGVDHPGEWSDADADATLYAYYQDDSGWNPVEIGVIPSALKDISIADLDNDGFIEIVTVTFNAATMTVFSLGEDRTYTKVIDRTIDNLHEGLDVGDLDGDGLLDIAANGYWLKNPGDLNQEWPLLTIDSRWFSQEEEHWSRNATKVVCKDIDGNGRADVFISHSEKSGYPIMRYEFDGESWSSEVLVENISAAHSLRVEDMDLDGDFEVLTGVNRNRAIDISKENGTETPTVFPVLLLDKTGGVWEADTLHTEGVYNLLSGDFDGDGDIDLLRLTSHDRQEMDLMVNQRR